MWGKKCNQTRWDNKDKDEVDQTLQGEMRLRNTKSHIWIRINEKRQGNMRQYEMGER